MNMVLYLTKRDLPADVLVVHRMRSQFVQYRVKMSLLVSLTEFAQKFGADSGQMGRILSPIVDMAEQAEESYLSQDFEGCQELMDSVFSELSRAELEVVEIKERVLMWIYLSEGLVITGTFMISGFLLWTVMIRRKLYRQVETTQLQRKL